MTSKEESLFLQRKNPRKIAWTTVFRRVNKKGVSEEVAKKRSRKTVKHQRGVVGADAQAILAKRNQQPAVRAAQRCVSLSLALLLLLRLARGADSSVARPPRLSARLALFIRLPPTFPLDLSPRPAPSLRRSAAAVTEAKDKKKEREAQRKSQRASNKPVANAVPKGGKVGRGAR